eukprot:3425594-Alexandrium_andersonii.AAC.1
MQASKQAAALPNKVSIKAMDHFKRCQTTKEANPTKDSLKDWSATCDTIARKLKGALASKE